MSRVLREMRFRMDVEAYARVDERARASGLPITSWARQAVLLALDTRPVAEERARYRMALEAIAVSRAVDPERLRELARVALGR